MASTAAVLFMAGVVSESWSLVVLGLLVLTTLMSSLVSFIPKSAAVRRRKLELAWWVPTSELNRGSVTPHTPFPLRVYLRNKAPFSLGWAHIEAIKSPAVIMEREPPLLRLEGLSETGATCSLSANATGHWFLHGAALTLVDTLGFFELNAFFSTSLEIQVFPKLGLSPLRLIRAARVGVPHQRTGAHRMRLTGFGGELREIREHRPGDPFKQIAWAPTARFRKLMVTEYESEILMNHHLILDISSTMRDREPGSSKLDYAVDFCASFSREALDSGDRVGLITVDSRILREIRTSDGRPHLFRIVEHLMELHNVVDEDLTDLTDMELVEGVAIYLLYQEGVDVRPRHFPDRDSDRWKHLMPGPSGQLYDLKALDTWAKGLLDRLVAEPSLTPKWLRRRGRPPAKSPRMARLRKICRLKGIHIPYRTGLLPENKARGVAAAVRKVAAAHRSHHIVLVTDLMGLHVRGSLRTALQLARRRRHQVTVLCPFAPLFHKEEGEEPTDKLLHRIFATDEMRTLTPVFQELAKLGVRVEMGAPDQIARTLGLGRDSSAGGARGRAA